jgi:hypothetical protein
MQAYTLSGLRPPGGTERFTQRLQEALVMAGMVSLRNDLAVEFGDWWSFNWQTNVITLPKRELSSCSRRGDLLDHPTRSSPRLPDPTAPHPPSEKTLQRPEIQVLLNCIEDVRIENWLVERFPGSRPWKEVAQRIAGRADPKSPSRRAQENPAVGFLRGLMRFGNRDTCRQALNGVSRSGTRRMPASIEGGVCLRPPKCKRA